MTTIDPLTRAELEHNAATASLMAERRREQWRNAIPTSTRSAALAREVRSWETQAASWTAVLKMVNTVALAPVLDAGTCSHPSWEADAHGVPIRCTDCGHWFTMSERLDRADRCSFCEHRYHGDDDETMRTCTQTGCACYSERMARR